MLLPGVLFLDELHAFAPWCRGPGGWLDDRIGKGSLLPPAIEPPSGLVVVVRPLAWDRIDLSAAWLRLARRIVVLVDGSAETEPLEAELRQLEEEERARTVERLGNVLDVRVVDDRGIDRAIREALEVVGLGPWRFWEEREPCPASGPGPWIAWPHPSRHEGETEGFLRLFAPALCRHDGRPTLLDGVSGARLDLLSGERTPVPDLAGASTWWSPVAAAPDGRRWLRSNQGWMFDGPGPSRPLPGGRGQAIGVDPTGSVAWTGTRCRFDWHVVTGEGPAWWTPSDHDWPCGHGKKLYGYADNDPLWVHLAADASACLSVYEHDALLVPGLPLRWRNAGGFAIAERAAGEPRALLHQRADGGEGFPGDPGRGDEDARDRFATVTLGPSDELRYVVGLDEATWRLRGESGTRLGGREEGWVACDSTHAERSRGSGRLLAGADRWIVVLEDGRLRREDLVTGRFEALGPAGRPIAAALAMPGSPNALLLSIDGAEAALRLV